MQYNLEQIIDVLHAFQTGSTTVKDFAFGNLSEITTSKSQEYPLMYVEVEKAKASENTMEITFNILIGDQENHSRTNTIDIYSQTLSIQNELISYMQRNLYTLDFSIPENIPLQPFSMRFNNQITGWFMTLPITLSRTNSC